MKNLRLALLAALTACAFTSSAQMGGPPKTGFDAALTKLFGNTTAFSAKSELRILDKSQKEKLSMPMDFALLDGKLRTEVDLAKMKGREVTPDQGEMMKQMGMDRLISLARPDKKSLYLVLPSAKACVNMPMSNEDAAALEKEPQMEKTSLGKETLDGHPCEKSKIILTDANGKKSEALVWNATDLKDFPIQIQTMEKGETFIFHYRDVQFAKPDAKLFELPAGYTTYDSMQAFTMGMMQKMMSGLDKE